MRTQQRPRRQRGVVARLRLLVGVLAGMLLLTSCDFSIYSVPLPGGPDTGDDPMTLTAEFRDVMDLVPQSNVKVDDVDVGRITDIRVDGYTAVVEMEVRRDLDLPPDTFARIRQTSLLGEKFVSLDRPEGSSTTAGTLESGAVIPLERTGRNPEVEEVLGALSLLLNGGGIGQLQVITQELNQALGGREPEVRSALRRLNRFATVADDNKGDIVAAIDSLNSLAEGANEQTESIELALDELPDATLSLDRQRDDLVEALTALDDLSGVGVRVIRASKAGTIRSLELLEPVLRQLANADDDVAFALQTFLTFPFVDETVGRDPQVARTIEFGDYVNLDVQLDLSLGVVGDAIGVVCDELDSLVLKRLIESGLPIDQVRDLINGLCDVLRDGPLPDCLDDVSGGLTDDEFFGCIAGIGTTLNDVVCGPVAGLLGISPPGCGTAGGGDRGGGGLLDPPGNGPRLPDLRDPLDDLGNGLGGLLGGGSRTNGNGTRNNGGGSGGGGGGIVGGILGGLGRTAPGAAIDGAPLTESWYRLGDLAEVYDSDLTALLVPPMSRATVPGGAS